MVSFSRLVQFPNRNDYDFYSYSADLIIRTKRIKTENENGYYSKWIDFKQKMTINILLKTLAELLPKVYQFLISLKNLKESWLNFAENLGCLGKFLSKNLGRYQRVFKQIQIILKKKLRQLTFKKKFLTICESEFFS